MIKYNYTKSAHKGEINTGGKVALAEEERIDVSGLIEEIKLILPDYFECKITSESDFIKLNFANGQKFIIKIEEY